jgi:hypothetical protein
VAEQTIRVNVPDGYEIVAIDVPKAGIDYVLCGDDVILAPATVYSRVIVRKVEASSETSEPRCSLPEVADTTVHSYERERFEKYYRLDDKLKERFPYELTVQVSLQGKYKCTDVDRAWNVWLDRSVLERNHTSDLVSICQRAATLRDKVMQTWDPPLKMRENESIATVAQTATMQTIAYIMGPEFMGKLDRNQQQAIDSGMLLFRAAFEDAKA